MEAVPGKTAPVRLASIDAYRGFVMFLMMAEVLHVGKVAAHFPGHPVWEFLKFHTSHVAWTGCSLHDLIQPSFSFLVGVALPFSLASRTARGQSRATMTAHACWRALLLILLGVFLRSLGWPRTNWTFDDTLTQHRPRLSPALPARLRGAARAVVGVRCDSPRLRARVGAVSGGSAGL